MGQISKFIFPSSSVVLFSVTTCSVLYLLMIPFFGLAPVFADKMTCEHGLKVLGRGHQIDYVRAQAKKMLDNGRSASEVDQYILGEAKAIAGSSREETLHLTQQVYGLEMGRFDGTRFDRRPPSEIKTSNGLYPRSAEMETTHLGHVQEGNNSSFVSVTIGDTPGNFVQNGYAWGGSSQNRTMVSLEDFDTVLEKYGAQMINWPVRDYTAVREGREVFGYQIGFVYSIKNATGYKTPERFLERIDHGFQTEAEFISLGIPSDQIKSVRPVIRLTSFEKKGDELIELRSTVAYGEVSDF